MASGELTELETAIEKIVQTFFTYAAREGKKGTLTAGEFKDLVSLQLPHLMKVGLRRGKAGGTGAPRLPPEGDHHREDVGKLPLCWPLGLLANCHVAGCD